MLEHVNVNSLRYKFDYFHDILSNNLLDVLCITETKLDDTFANNQFHCNGYRCHRKDKTCFSGGIIIWVRSDIPHERLMHYEIASNDVENIIIYFNLKTVKFNSSCVYKKPAVSNTVFINYMSEMMDKLTNDGYDNVLVGDLNVDMISDENVIDNELCDTYGMKNISSPTYFKSKPGTLIDPVLVSNSNLFCKPFNTTCGSSDWHNMVGCTVKIKFPKCHPSCITYRDYKNFDESRFRQELEKLPTQVGHAFDNVDDQYWTFTNMYSALLNEHAPLKTKTLKSRKIPYMHSELMKAIHTRNHYKNLYFKNRTSKAFELYRQNRNRVTKMRKKAIKDYFMKFSSKNASPKEFWKCFKPFFTDKGSNTSADIVLKQDNVFVCDRKQVCEIMNEFFISIADEIGQPEPANPNVFTVIKRFADHASVKKIKEIHGDTPEFKFRIVNQEYVMKLLSKLKVDKSTGFDNIPPKIAKLSAKSIAGTLSSIINKAFESNTFPSDMKKSEVSPLHKKSDHTIKENYRPISIIVVFSKVMETIIAEQITEHMNDLFDQRLGAYRKGHGCSQVLVSAVDTWKKSLDSGMFVGTLLMDLSKAFDSIPHGLLLAKLKCYGFSDDACLFMANYLQGRKQRVKLKDCRSSWLTVKRGIPQGSCLGPLLFNIFINDLFFVVKDANLFNYADDNTLSISHKEIDYVIELLVKDTTNTMKWFLDNYMQANPQKFQVMFMKPQKLQTELPSDISINDITISTNDKVKLLGVTIDSNLNFDNHVRILCKKASMQLKVLFRFKSYLGRREREQMYKTFILSNFNFCPVVWNFCSKTSARKIEKIQERALRFLTGYHSLSYQELLQKTGCETMHLNRMKFIAIEVFKCVHNLNPGFMNEMFIIKEFDRNMRDPCILIVPRFKTIMYEKKNIFVLWSSYLEFTSYNHKTIYKFRFL